MNLRFVLPLLGFSVLALGPAHAEGPRTLLYYQAPEVPEGETAELEAYDFSQWESGDRVATARSTALRAEADGTAPIVRDLELGVEVEVRERVEARRRLDGRVGQWYRVAAEAEEGYVFGGDLTPFAYRVDLDGDGKTDAATVSFGPDFEIKIRVRDGLQGQTSELELRATGGAYIGVRGGDIEVFAHPRTMAGIPLLEVRSFVEACADYTHRFVSYTRDDDGAVPRLALELAGLTDPPTFATFEASFDAANLGVTVDEKVVTEDDEGRDVVEDESTRRLVLEDGVYVERESEAGH